MPITTSYPGVYLEELNSMSLSVSSSATAVPVFAITDMDDTFTTCTRISSWMDYQSYFEGSSDSENMRDICIRTYFENGGGYCYLIPFNELESKVPELDDATLLVSAGQNIQSAVTMLCGEGKNIFAILDGPTHDVRQLPPLEKDRNREGYRIDMYGNRINDAGVLVDSQGVELLATIELNEQGHLIDTETSSLVHRDGWLVDAYGNKINTNGDLINDSDEVLVGLTLDADGHLVNVEGLLVNREGQVIDDNGNRLDNDVLIDLDGNTVDPAVYDVDGWKNDYDQTAYAAIYYPWLKAKWTDKAIPPSAAIAGAYCQNDSSRGVWKAPANMPLRGGVLPAFKVNDDFQGQYTSGGKALNIIRQFHNGSPVIWGTRTCDDTDSWRYVPVRRLFNSAEKDIQNTMQTMMFEPNSQPTWERIRSAITQYLYKLWQQGALSGSTAEEAFFVEIGKDITMDEADINQGKMIVKVGMAAVRPAEFIILQFTQDVDV